MAKAKVTFKPVRNSDDDWNIVAEYPGVEPREITGLKSKADVDDWMNGESPRYLAALSGLRQISRQRKTRRVGRRVLLTSHGAGRAAVFDLSPSQL
jgi:hypothetical protein